MGEYFRDSGRHAVIIFDDLSKHNKMFWGSDDMNEIRMKLSCLQDELLGIRELLEIDPYEGNV